MLLTKRQFGVTFTLSFNLLVVVCIFFFFFSSRRRHTRLQGDWSSDVCSSDLRRRFLRVKTGKNRRGCIHRVLWMDWDFGSGAEFFGLARKCENTRVERALGRDRKSVV